MMDDIPDLPREALEQFTDAELVAYVEMLEDKAREAARRSFPLFARKTEVPGVPDKSKIKASDWRRVLAEERGLEVEDDDPDEAIDWYPDRLAPAAHHDLIMETVQGCIEETLRTPDGDVVDGVMVFLPPGSGKSTYTSMLAPAYFMGRFPNFNVIGVSYAQSLADRFSRRAREICSRDSYRELMGTGLAAGSTGVQNWSLDNGSEYRAAGIQAAVTGFRADLLAWDDPVAGAEEADSEVIQNKTFEAWQTDLSTRLKPGGKQLGIMTRWNMGDLAGRILSDEKSDEKWNGQSGHWKGTDGRNWYIICLPMIAENDDDPLGRKPGELLWPEHFRARDVEKIRARAEREGGSRAWSALYQQRPSVSGGNIVKRTWWQQWTKRDEYGPIPPECSAVYLFYDTAFEAKETADYSAMTAWGIFERIVRTPGGREFNHHQAVLLTSWQERVDAVELPKIIKKHTERFEKGGTNVEIFVEGRASGKQIIQELRRMRLPVREWLPKGPKGALGKVPRTHAATFPFESGCIWYIPSADTLQVIDQVSDFPNAPHDDLHDTVTMAMDIFRRRFLVQMPSDELDDDEYEEDILRRRAEKKRLENRRLYG
jgi:phage terminase large subunit-like protein